MNTEDFIQYAILLAIVIAGGAFLLWDAWRDRRDAARKTCCPPGYGCNKCYYGLAE